MNPSGEARLKEAQLESPERFGRVGLRRADRGVRPGVSAVPGGVETRNAQGNGIEHIETMAAFPGALGRQESHELGEVEGHRSGYFLLRRQSVTGHDLFYAVGSQAHDGDSIAPCERGDLAAESTQERSMAGVPSYEGFLNGKYGRAEISDEPQDGTSDLPEPLFLRGHFAECFNASVEKISAFKNRHAHLASAWIDGQDSFRVTHGGGMFQEKGD